ncbi:MAG: hypothetical protein M3Z09_15425 [Acidobacteriota bacterium]|nr:hypothetical protein [Acidobacteriota bacterium]
MKCYSFVLAGFLAITTLFAATDPFVGTWIYNREKSPKPTIKYLIKDLGGNRFALTGSTGQTITIKADGVSINSPYGGNVSFRKMDDHNWQMVRSDPEKMVRTYTVSSDDKTLILNDVFTRADGKQDKTVTTYARLSPGKSLMGEWQSVSMKDEPSTEAGELFIAPYGKDGLSFTSSLHKNRLDINFDGKMYFERGPTARKGESTSGRRVNAHLLQAEGQIDGKLDDKEEWKVSDDGKTLTIVNKPVKSSAVFTSVFDKR